MSLIMDSCLILALIRARLLLILDLSKIQCEVKGKKYQIQHAIQGYVALSHCSSFKNENQWKYHARGRDRKKERNKNNLTTRYSWPRCASENDKESGSYPVVVGSCYHPVLVGHIMKKTVGERKRERESGRGRPFCTSR
ncbi:hypothetical protein BC828DRAFT_57336 [Blastocladiella britannica]|nr:hypothetical protein BC828DRAFT_57336 [Blastocladiella britannica]